MKLINKTLFNYLAVSIPLLILASILSYFLIRNELQDGMDETLEREKLNVQKLIEGLKEPANTYLGYDSLSFIKVIAADQLEADRYSDTSIHYKRWHEKSEFRNYRMLRSSYNFKNTNYRITLTRTTLEEEELMNSLFSAFALVILFLILSFFLVSWLLSKKLWKPFYRTLDILGQYDLKNHTATDFQAEKITEFRQLNAELNKMTDKIHRDFVQQKEFTENASHEMQTPLAVVRANLSLLMQSAQMQEAEMNHLAAIENTIKKLTSLNKTLILLSKIENNQYHEQATVHLKEKAGSALELFSDLLQAKGLRVVTRFDADPSLTMNPVLADVLINNLLQNAIRHNAEGGEIILATGHRSFSISNSGAPLTIAEEDLFTRFKKNDASKDSLGLGLSIVKSIAGLYGMEIQYAYVAGLHNFTLIF